MSTGNAVTFKFCGHFAVSPIVALKQERSTVPPINATVGGTENQRPQLQHQYQTLPSTYGIQLNEGGEPT